MRSAAAESDAVFVGSTVEAVPLEENTFEVRTSDVYRGSPGGYITVTGGVYEDAVLLQQNRQYLFFVTKSAGSWTALGCDATRPISSRVIAQADRAFGHAIPLRAAPSGGDSGPGESPSATAESGTGSRTAESTEDDGLSSWMWVGVGIALLAGVAGVPLAYWLLNRKRSESAEPRTPDDPDA